MTRQGQAPEGVASDVSVPESTPSFSTGEIEGSGSALPAVPPGPAALTAADMPHQLAELNALMRQLVGAITEQTNLAKEQLVLARKAEQRFEEQRNAQRDDFQRWLAEHGLAKERTKPAEETARAVLGQAIAELVDYVEDNGENLADGTDFIRSEMSDKFGGLLHHLWVIYGTLKHLSAADQPNAGPKPPAA
jgi:type VI protein secretion system component VasK